MKLLPLTPADYRPWASLLSLTTGQPYTTLRQRLASKRPDTAVTWGAWDGPSLVALFSARPMTLHWPQQSRSPRVALAQAPVIHPRYNQAELFKTVTQPVLESLRRQGVQAIFQFERRSVVWPWFHQAPPGYRFLGRLQPYWGWLSQRPTAVPLRVTTHCPDQLPPRRHAAQITFMLDIDDVRERYCAALDETYHFAVCQKDAAVTGLVVYQLSRAWGVSVAQLVAVYGQDVDTLLLRWLATMYDNGHRVIHTVTTPHAAVRQAVRQHTRRLGEQFSAEQYLLYAQPLQRYVPPVLLNLAQWNCIASDAIFQ